MIDAANITKYNANTPELEELIIFWVLAAGKNGTTAAKCLDKLLNALNYTGEQTPFKKLLYKKKEDPSTVGGLAGLMRSCGIGCYNLKSITLYDLASAELDLKTCDVAELEGIKGIGPKTARCFILHSRRNAQVAGLDTHMLKHLRANGVQNVPLSTPSSKKLYAKLEKEVLKLAGNAGMSPADYDLMVWNSYKVG